MQHHLRSLARLIVGGLALGACTLDFNTVINRSGGGTFTWEYGLNKEEQATLIKEGSSAEAFCAGLQSESDLPKGATLDTEWRGDDFFCIVNLPPFNDLEALRQTYADLGGVTVNRLEIANNQLRYDLTLHIASDDPKLGQRHPLLTWRLTLPGRVTDHNADKIEGNTLAWEIKIGEARHIRAESSIGLLDFLDGETGKILAGACACLLGLGGLGLAGGAYWFTQRQKKPADEES